MGESRGIGAGGSARLARSDPSKNETRPAFRTPVQDGKRGAAPPSKLAGQRVGTG